MSDAGWRAIVGWLLYFSSAAPFIAFVVLAFTGNLDAEPANIIIVNGLIFAAAGTTAALVKNMAFNAFMAVNSVPYALFLLAHRGVDDSRWSLDDKKGSVVLVSIYAMIGMASTAVWLLIRTPAVWRWLRSERDDTAAKPP